MDYDSGNTLPFLEQVLWRYNGKKPGTLGPNTQILPWIPQNDLLGKPVEKKV